MMNRLKPLALVVAVAILFASASTAQAQEVQYYTAYGDSITNGGASGGLPYVLLYDWQASIDMDKYTYPINLGVGGHRSQDILAQLNTAQGQNANRASRIITVGIGYNDIALAQYYYVRKQCGGADGQDCYRLAVSMFKNNWDQILSKLEAQCSREGTAIRVRNNYQTFAWIQKQYTFPSNGSDWDVHLRYLKQVNGYIERTSASYGIPMADIHHKFNGSSEGENPAAKQWFSPMDLVHPNPIGNVVIADEFRKLGYEPNCYGTYSPTNNQEGAVSLRPFPHH